MIPNSEADFEATLIEVLSHKGWESQVLKNPTETDLLQNWADILFNNNSSIDRLNNIPLTDSEMQQIIEQIRALKTPLKLNNLINGKTVYIVRDNPADRLHLGKEISLEIYDRQAIAAGNSRYQIVQQPQFAKKSNLMRNRRGDVMLLINGMPVIHIELKRSGVPVSHAINQIEKYSDEGVFTGLFALVQIFIAMSPSETLYFANPGQKGHFNKDYFFHWADFNNEPINDWKNIASTLLSIPMAHQLIGFYTVADSTDGVLKVMRSYQYYAARAISDKVAKINWANSFDKHTHLGGYVWHTTGSGKTLTSFKSAQLIAQSKDADKVVFLMDRIELGVQSLLEYRGFAGDTQAVQATENTHELISKLKSNDFANTLIVSSIQKMSNINEDDGVLKSDDIAQINAKRIVFIVDEAHRSTFGDMLITIKKTFSSAIFFGFTGTPIQAENQKKNNTTSSVFGNELHRYSIADGIRDKNVLGFDPYKVLTFKDKDLRRAVALLKAKVNSESEAFADPKKKAIFNRYMNDVPMAGYKNDLGHYEKGIEDEIPPSQYGDTHKQQVITDILDNRLTLSQDNKFHAILATHSIADAIDYYRRIKKAQPELKITALFDPHINEGEDYQSSSKFKQEGLLEIIADYNQRYEQSFDLARHAKFKKDLSARLAHKKPYLRIEKSLAQQLDLLIVVDQMLTGFDSKWLNTLYLDKLLSYENIIQAFSRTNRLFGPDKPFGTIRYYRYPHTMQRNINEAVKLYSGDKPIGLFVDKLESNLKKMNNAFTEIQALFSHAGINNFEKLPDDNAERGQFAKLFHMYNESLEAAKIQGFVWEDDKTRGLDENTYLVLILRYKELARNSKSNGGSDDDIPFDINTSLAEYDMGKIDANYMNRRFNKYLKTLSSGADAVEIQNTIDELHQSFASLTQEEQKFAAFFLHDVQRGDVTPQADKTFRDYITEYQSKAQNSQMDKLANSLATNPTAFKNKLTAIMNSVVTDANINEFGRFEALKDCVDQTKAKAYFEKQEGKSLNAFKIKIAVDKLLQKFIIHGGFEV